jgi:FkbM family methyltransferase
MSLLSTLQFIINHPLNKERKAHSLLDFLKWQIGSRLVPGKVVYSWVNGTKIIVGPGETGFTGNIYCGLHEFPDMAYLLHVLDSSDLFVDIGANVGSYTLLACGVKGAKGYCFEPVPETYRRLMDNIRLNDLFDKVSVRNIGLSHKEDELMFTSDENCMNHVVADGERPHGVIKVKVFPLDVVLDAHEPTMLKIDVEGFEMHVLNGAHSILNNQSLHSVIMELNGSGLRYGFRDEEIINKMNSYGFLTYDYEPFTRVLIPLAGKSNLSGNTLFIRNVAFVQKKIYDSPGIVIGDNVL